MEKLQWEYDLVEKPFCQQLQAMGWEWLESDPDLPESTERSSSREVLLKSRLTKALHRVNLRDAQPWLDDSRIARAVRDLEQAAVTYHQKLLAARDELVAQLEALSPSILCLSESEVAALDAETRFLMAAHSHLPLLRALETAVVISGDHNDPETWWNWSDKARQQDCITRFKRKLAVDKTEKTDPLAFLIVNNMLLTGFDAPVEQVLYLDRKVIVHELAQLHQSNHTREFWRIIDRVLPDWRERKAELESGWQPYLAFGINYGRRESGLVSVQK